MQNVCFRTEKSVEARSLGFISWTSFILPIYCVVVQKGGHVMDYKVSTTQDESNVILPGKAKIDIIEDRFRDYAAQFYQSPSFF